MNYLWLKDSQEVIICEAESGVLVVYDLNRHFKKLLICFKVKKYIQINRSYTMEPLYNRYFGTRNIEVFLFQWLKYIVEIC